LFRLDCKYYFVSNETQIKTAKETRLYTGIGLWYIEEQDNIADFGIHVKNRIITCNFGGIVDYSRFSIDVSGNIGIRFKERSFVNLQPNPPFTDDAISGWGQTSAYTYKGVLPHIGFSIKLGWRLF